MTGDEARARLRATVDGGGAIIGAGAGTGLSAKCAQDGGADLIIIYNSGRYRMAGRGSLAGLMPYGDANAIVLDMAREVLPVARDTPVLAGVCGTDPFRLMDRFLNEVLETGFAGVQNFPTVGLIDGTFRINLEETGMSYALEVEMIRAARHPVAPGVVDDDQVRAAVLRALGRQPRARPRADDRPAGGDLFAQPGQGLVPRHRAWMSSFRRSAIATAKAGSLTSAWTS